MRDRHQILHHFLLGGDLLSTSNSLPCLRHRCCNSSNPKRANRSLWATTSFATSSATTESTNLGRLKFRPPPISSINSRLAIPLAMANSSTIRRWFFKSGRCAWDGNILGRLSGRESFVQHYSHLHTSYSPRSSSRSEQHGPAAVE